MLEKHNSSIDTDELEFPLPRNTPLNPQEATDSIGNINRQFECNKNNVPDFPQNVSIKLVSGIEINATLKDLRTDAGNRIDGTFYFKENVRNGDDYIFGNEIETITFLD